MALRALLSEASRRLCRQALLPMGEGVGGARGFKRNYLSPDATPGDIYEKGQGLRVAPGSPIRIGINMGGILGLNDLRDNPGSRQTVTRVGRGIGSGKGKTSGRGHKGQKSRSGRSPRLGFEGGQTPLRKRVPKKGFFNVHALNFQPLNLSKVRDALEANRLSAEGVITMKKLYDARVIGKMSNKWHGVKLLGAGKDEFKLPINIEVSRCSAAAQAAIEAAGGSVTKVHYNRLGMRALLKPHKWEEVGKPLPRPARPPPKVVPNVDRAGTLPPPQ